MKRMNPLQRIHIRVSNHVTMTDAKSFKCSECGEIVSESASYCPGCGATFDDRPDTNNETNFLLEFNPSDEPIVLLGVVAIISIVVSVIIATRFNRLLSSSMGYFINYTVTVVALIIWTGVIYYAHSGSNQYNRTLPGLGILGIGTLLLIRSLYIWYPGPPHTSPLSTGRSAVGDLVMTAEAPRFLAEIVIIEPIGAFLLAVLNLNIIGMDSFISRLIINSIATGHSALTAFLYIILGIIVFRE